MPAKRVGRCKLVVARNRAKGKEYRKAIVNLPAKVLEHVKGGEEFNVFVADGKIVLATSEALVEEELLGKLVELFTQAFRDPEIGPKLVQKYPILIGAIVNLLEKLNARGEGE